MNELTPCVSPVGDSPDIYQRLIKNLNKKRQSWGILRSALFDLSPRFRWWSLALLNQRMPNLSYEKIDFSTHFSESDPPIKMIKECIKPFPYDNRVFDNLVEFLLYSFGDSSIKSIAHLDYKQVEHFKREFDLKVMFDYPGDYFGHYFEIHIDRNEKVWTL